MMMTLSQDRMSLVKMSPQTRGPRTKCPLGQLVLGLCVPLGHLVLGSAVPPHYILAVLSSVAFLLHQSYSASPLQPGAVKLLVKKLGELLMAHDSSLMTQILYI